MTDSSIQLRRARRPVVGVLAAALLGLTAAEARADLKGTPLQAQRITAARPIHVHRRRAGSRTGRPRTVQRDGVRFHTTRNGFFRVDYNVAREPWQGVQYDSSRTRAFGGLQIVRWLRVFANFNAGGAIFYDTTAPFQGDSTSASFELTFQPSSRLTEDVSIQRVDFNRRTPAPMSTT